MTSEIAGTIYATDEIIPIQDWGRDHWSLLLYIDSIMTDCGGFQVGYDSHMTHNRRNWRIMQRDCKRPKRVKSSAIVGPVMDAKYTSRLINGSTSNNHDDWCSVQDFVEAGLFTSTSEVEPRKYLQFSDIGRNIVQQIRVHKQAGGSLGTFTLAVTA